MTYHTTLMHAGGDVVSCRRYRHPFAPREDDEKTFYSYLRFQPESAEGPFDTSVIDAQLPAIRAVLIIADMLNLSLGSLDLEAIYEGLPMDEAIYANPPTELKDLLQKDRSWSASDSNAEIDRQMERIDEGYLMKLTKHSTGTKVPTMADCERIKCAPT